MRYFRLYTGCGGGNMHTGIYLYIHYKHAHIQMHIEVKIALDFFYNEKLQYYNFFDGRNCSVKTVDNEN